MAVWLFVFPFLLAINGSCVADALASIAMEIPCHWTLANPEADKLAPGKPTAISGDETWWFSAKSANGKGNICFLVL